MSDLTAARGEQTRQDILLAAHQLFLSNGYHGTSMRKIADKAGIALGGIYNHFPSKEELFLEVLIRFHPIFDVLPALANAEGETVAELVNDAAQRLVSNIEKRIDFLNLLFIELVEFNGQHLPRLFHFAFPQIMAFAQRALQDRPELRPIPLPILLRAFIGLFFSYVMTDILIGEQLSVEFRENSLEYFVDMFLHGILVNQPGSN
jgi:AcrR family transcriptional regulator